MTNPTSFGIAKWTGERQEEFFAWCASFNYDPFKIDVQIEYIFHELSTHPELGMAQLKNAKTIDEAVEIFTEYYLGYDEDELSDSRKAFARDAFERFC